MIKLASLTLSMALLAPVAALATVQNLGASADVAQTVPLCAAGSSAQGTATVTLDDANGLLSWTVTFGNNAPGFDNGLLDQGVELFAHFHGPALPGVPAGVQVAILGGSPSVGSQTISAAQMADVLNDMWYINIHSTNCSSGEIRGQLLVVTATPALPTWGWVLFGVLALCGAGLLSRRAFLKT